MRRSGSGTGSTTHPVLLLRTAPRRYPLTAASSAQAARGERCPADLGIDRDAARGPRARVDRVLGHHAIEPDPPARTRRGRDIGVAAVPEPAQRAVPALIPVQFVP